MLLNQLIQHPLVQLARGVRRLALRGQRDQFVLLAHGNDDDLAGTAHSFFFGFVLEQPQFLQNRSEQIA